MKKFSVLMFTRRLYTKPTVVVVVVVLVVVVGQTGGSISCKTLAYDCLYTLEL